MPSRCEVSIASALAARGITKLPAAVAVRKTPPGDNDDDAGRPPSLAKLLADRRYPGLRVEIGTRGGRSRNDICYFGDDDGAVVWWMLLSALVCVAPGWAGLAFGFGRLL